MGSWWKDIVSTALVIFGGVVMFAKIQSYTWWLIGTWKGALGVLAVTGALLFLVNLRQLLEFDTLANYFEVLLWAGTITFFTTALWVTTTKAEFIIGGSLLAAAWLIQFFEDIWDHATHPKKQYITTH